MGTVYSIRGTNGSGKTTVARRFLPAPLEKGAVLLNSHPAPTKKDPGREKRVPGYLRESQQLGRVGVVGPYNSACGGLDQVADFAVSRGAIWHMLTILECRHVIAEGLLASGVYGSWGQFSKTVAAAGHTYAWCYMQTPLGVCFERIRARQAAAGRANKVIQWDLVSSKYDQVISNRARALAAGEVVYDLPYGGEVAALIDIMEGKGEKHFACQAS